MAIIAKEESGVNYEIIPTGVYLATCYSVIDLGLQFNEKFGNKKREIQIRWEIPEERIIIDNEDKPRTIVAIYTLSLSEKAKLRAVLEAWRGKKFTEQELLGFDLKNILNKSCQVQMVHSEDGKYANPNSFMAIPKGLKTNLPENELIYFDLSEGTLQEIDKQLEKISEKTKEKIMKSETYLELKHNNKINCSPSPATITVEDMLTDSDDKTFTDVSTNTLEIRSINLEAKNQLKTKFGNVKFAQLMQEHTNKIPLSIFAELMDEETPALTISIKNAQSLAIACKGYGTIETKIKDLYAITSFKELLKSQYNEVLEMIDDMKNAD